MPSAVSAPPADPALGKLVSLWPSLPAHVRAGVMAMIEYADRDGRENA
ncbi:MAG: hypothetical protein AB8F26_05775 [Phycisphaerales bacterium]